MNRKIVFLGAVVGLILFGSLMATAIQAGTLGNGTNNQINQNTQGFVWKYKAEKKYGENANYCVNQNINNEQKQAAGVAFHFGYKDNHRERNRNEIRQLMGNCTGLINLINISGFLEKNDSVYFIDGITLKFNPYRYVYSNIATYDYDNDGFVETLAEELEGLIDSYVILSGHLNENNELIVVKINGMIYREPGKPEWAGSHQL